MKALLAALGVGALALGAYFAATYPALEQALEKKDDLVLTEAPLERLAREEPGFSQIALGEPIDRAMSKAAKEFATPSFISVDVGVEGSMTVVFFEEGNMGRQVVLVMDLATELVTGAYLLEASDRR